MNKTRLYAVNRLIDGVFIIRVYNAAKTLLVVNKKSRFIKAALLIHKINSGCLYKFSSSFPTSVQVRRLFNYIFIHLLVLGKLFGSNRRQNISGNIAIKRYLRNYRTQIGIKY